MVYTGAVNVWSRPKDMEAASDSAQLSAQDSTQRACDLVSGLCHRSLAADRGRGTLPSGADVSLRDTRLSRRKSPLQSYRFDHASIDCTWS